MAEKQQERRKKSDKSGAKKQDKADAPQAGAPSFKDYLKLGATFLVALLLFAGVIRGCASYQDKNPLTGEPLQKETPPPPPPPPAS